MANWNHHNYHVMRQEMDDKLKAFVERDRTVESDGPPNCLMYPGFFPGNMKHTIDFMRELGMIPQESEIIFHDENGLIGIMSMSTNLAAAMGEKVAFDVYVLGKYTENKLFGMDLAFNKHVRLGSYVIRQGDKMLEVCVDYLGIRIV